MYIFQKCYNSRAGSENGRRCGAEGVQAHNKSPHWKQKYVKAFERAENKVQTCKLNYCFQNRNIKNIVSILQANRF